MSLRYARNIRVFSAHNLQTCGVPVLTFGMQECLRCVWQAVFCFLVA